jgi:hypothetical protein
MSAASLAAKPRREVKFENIIFLLFESFLIPKD